MIISFQRKFIFVAIPKTAGHAVRRGLREHLTDGDWEQCTLYEQRLFPVADLARIGHGHLSCQQIRPYLLPGMWEQFFTFAFVRNPYDRFISFSFFHHAKNPGLRKDPLNALKRIFAQEKQNRNVLFRPQKDFLTDPKGNLMVDFIGRYESLQDDFQQVCDRLRLPSPPLSRVNSSDRTLRKEDLDQELEESIYSHYKADFLSFGYERIGTQDNAQE